jgi:methylmalonyl-CoA mutase cobalamin-binding subunit
LVMLFRGHPSVATHCRSAAQWRELLRECGFEVQVTPMSHGTHFANVLLIGYAQ